ncbi:MAG TPA: hypothetical protein EYN67_11805 [Flavobacteriales bacterium]|nr:hypothetical protein [Flavobacteriales bacterium]
MSLLSFSVLCGMCNASMDPNESWRVDDMPECTTRMSWMCNECGHQICIQMIDIDAEETVVIE